MWQSLQRPIAAMLSARPDSTLTRFASQVLAIAWKDVLVESRTKEVLSSTFVFAVLVIVVFNFAFELRVETTLPLAPGVLWVAIIFAGVLGLGRSFVAERDRGCLEGLILCPADRGAIYLGKLLGNLLFMVAVEAVLLPIFFVLFNLPVALYAVFFYAPREAMMGDVQRIFYFHVPSANIAFLAFAVVFVSSAQYLRTRDSVWDARAHASAEIGVVFCTVALVTGSIWAKPIWGAWWTWDPRLTTTLVLWLIYVSYLMLRRALDEPERRGRFAAVVGIVGFVDVPLVFMSIRWWRTIHPVVFKVDSIDVDGQMMVALVVSLVAFTLLYFYLLRLRVGLEYLQTRVEALQRARW